MIPKTTTDENLVENLHVDFYVERKSSKVFISGKEKSHLCRRYSFDLYKVLEIIKSLDVEVTLERGL